MVLFVFSLRTPRRRANKEKKKAGHTLTHAHRVSFPQWLVFLSVASMVASLCRWGREKNPNPHLGRAFPAQSSFLPSANSNRLFLLQAMGPALAFPFIIFRLLQKRRPRDQGQGAKEEERGTYSTYRNREEIHQHTPHRSGSASIHSSLYKTRSGPSSERERGS